MSINNLPAAIQDVIQQGYLERDFQTPLRAKIGFRAIAERETFSAGIGETITKTRTGLLPAVTTPLSPAANTDITSGLTPQNYPTEQYTLSVNQYSGNMMLNTVTSKVAIASLFLRNAMTLGEQAARSVDTLAQQALYSAYLGGNTRVRTTLGAPATTIAVDDIRGFTQTLNNGMVVAVSPTYPLGVMVGSTLYSMVGYAVDGSNVSTAPGGISGTLTFSANVSISDGTAVNPVVSSVAPLVVRPTNSSTGVMAPTTPGIASAADYNSGRMTMQMILQGKATLSANSVAPMEDGQYIMYADPIQLTGLYQDPAFQMFFRGKPETSEYRKGVVTELLGVTIAETNLNPVQYAVNGTGGFTFTAPIRRAAICGQGALVEGVFTNEGYRDQNGTEDDPLISVVDGIAHVTREPLDALKQVVTQSWSYIGGFVVPTDVTTNPTTIPTASTAALKRAVMLESL
jgi:hypothetical protein